MGFERVYTVLRHLELVYFDVVCWFWDNQSDESGGECFGRQKH